MDYEDFLLQLGPRGSRGIHVRASCRLAGQARGWFALPNELESLASHPQPITATGVREPSSRATRHLLTLESSTGSDRTTVEIGTSLFTALFSGEIHSIFDRSLGSVEGDSATGLRIKLQLDLTDEDEALLHKLPWELLYKPDTAEHLGLRRKCPIVRYLEVSEPVPTAPSSERLRVLAATANPSTAPPLDLAAELAALESLTGHSSAITVEHHRAKDLSSLRDRLLEGHFAVLHFMGHGDFDPVTGEGLILLEGKSDGYPPVATGSKLATALRDLTDLRLVVLNACNTGTFSNRPGINPFSGIAPALMKGGLPAVLAMQSPISDQSAIEFSKSFYKRLCAGDPIDTATSEGRHAIHSIAPLSAEWAIPALFMRVPNGKLFDHVTRAEEKGIKLLKSGSYRQAEAELRRSVADSPDSGLARVALGIALSRGRRLRRLPYRTANNIHKLFASALSEVSSRNPAAAALAALKLDYYQSNGVRDVAPPLETVLQALDSGALKHSELDLLKALNFSDATRRQLRIASKGT